MHFAKRSSLYLAACTLLLFLAACSPGISATVVQRSNIIQPCAQQFQPQVTLKRTVTENLAQRLYFISGVHLYALNAGSSALQWCLLISNSLSNHSNEVALAPLASVPPPPDGLVGLAAQDDRVFVSSMNIFTYAFAAANGKMLWQSYINYSGGKLSVAGDTLYLSSNSIYALSTHDGSMRWSAPTRDVVTSSAVVVDNTLYAGSYDNAVYALNAANGRTHWTYHTAGRVYVAPIVDHGVVYAGAGNDGPRLYALDAYSGRLLWHTDTIIDTDAQLLVADGLLYASQNGSLVGLDPQNGKVLWHYSGIQNASLLANGHLLYVASTSGALYAFDTHTHALIWQLQARTLSAGSVTSLKLIGNELYVGFNDLGQNQFASIHAIDARTGSEDWSASIMWNVGTLAIA